jgi:hypothetical protein
MSSGRTPPSCAPDEPDMMLRSGQPPSSTDAGNHSATSRKLRFAARDMSLRLANYTHFTWCAPKPKIGIDKWAQCHAAPVEIEEAPGGRSVT